MKCADVCALTLPSWLMRPLPFTTRRGSGNPGFVGWSVVSKGKISMSTDNTTAVDDRLYEAGWRDCASCAARRLRRLTNIEDVIRELELMSAGPEDFIND